MNEAELASMSNEDFVAEYAANDGEGFSPRLVADRMEELLRANEVLEDQLTVYTEGFSSVEV